jgi:hypothetical protein
MRMRRGFFRLMLLATLGWVAFVAYSAWGTMPKALMPVTATRISDYCRFAFSVTSDMSSYVVRYEAAAQYHRAKTSVQGTRCREYHQLSEEQVADIAGRVFMQWLSDQRMSFERQLNARLNTWIFNYLLHAIAPPLFVWLLVFGLVWVRDGFGRREEA